MYSCTAIYPSKYLCTLVKVYNIYPYEYLCTLLQVYIHLNISVFMYRYLSTCIFLNSCTGINSPE